MFLFFNKIILFFSLSVFSLNNEEYINLFKFRELIIRNI